MVDELRATAGLKDLTILSDVAAFAASGGGADEILTGITGVLKKGLQLEECRAWVRTPDGASFHAIGPVGADVPSEIVAAAEPSARVAVVAA